MDKDEGRRGKPAAGMKRSASSPAPVPGLKRRRAPAGPVGEALRTAYVEVVAEDIPPEMIDLLGKLD